MKPTIGTKSIIGGAAVFAMLTIGLPMSAQAIGQGQSQEQTLTANRSGTGVPGMAGVQSGATLSPSGKITGRATPFKVAGADYSNVRGMPGAQSGIAATRSAMSTG